MTTRTVIAADGTVTTRALTAPEIAALAALAPSAEQALAAWRAQAKVSPFQAKEQLRRDGLLPGAEAIVTAAGGTALMAWNFAGEFRRNSPTIISLATALGLSAEQLDALFVAAAGIEA